GTLSKGYVTIPVSLGGTGTFHVRANITDLAGNTTQTASQTIVVNSATTWSASNSGVRIADPQQGDPQLEMGDVTVSHTLDHERGAGTVESGNRMLIFHSDSVNQQPVVQATLQSANNAALPATITATLTWNGSAQTPVNLSTTGFAQGDALTV